MRNQKIPEEEKSKFERNIKLAKVMGALMWGRFFIPVLALFYIASQVPLEQFALIMGVFSFSTLVLEIPTGVIADLLGKKKTLLLSRFMYVIEIALITFFNGFWIFLIAKIISGVGVSLGSGTNSAMLYDSLKKLKREKEHKKISGQISYISNISMAFVFVIGAFLFGIYYKLPAIVSLPVIILGFLLTFLYTEPFSSKKKFTLRNSWNHLVGGLKEFVSNKYLVYLALFSLASASAISIMLSMSSAYLKEILVPVYLIGVVAFVSSMLTAFTARRAHKYEEKLGERNSLFAIQSIVILSVLLMTLMLPYFGVLFFLLISLISGFSGVVESDYVNKRVKSKNRATMLSINNMFASIGITALFPTLGYIIGLYSMATAYLLLGAFYLIYFVILAIVFASVKRNVK